MNNAPHKPTIPETAATARSASLPLLEMREAPDFVEVVVGETTAEVGELGIEVGGFVVAPVVVTLGLPVLEPVPVGVVVPLALLAPVLVGTLVPLLVLSEPEGVPVGAPAPPTLYKSELAKVLQLDDAGVWKRVITEVNTGCSMSLGEGVQMVHHTYPDRRKRHNDSGLRVGVPDSIAGVDSDGIHVIAIAIFEHPSSIL